MFVLTEEDNDAALATYRRAGGESRTTPRASRGRSGAPGLFAKIRTAASGVYSLITALT
jgi:hypothetical protein